MHLFSFVNYKLATFLVHVVTSKTKFSGSLLFRRKLYSPLLNHRQHLMTFSDQSGDSRDSEIIVSSSCDLQFYHLNYTVESTQEEAKRLLTIHPASNHPQPLVIIADNQSNGRGTGGRTWVASPGNLFMTCALPMKLIPKSKITLLPLVVGVVVAERLAKHSSTPPKVKWPNDVLIKDRKISGALIENYSYEQQNWWLVGVGVNIQSYPSELPLENAGICSSPRRASCLREHCDSNLLPTAVEIGQQMATDLLDLVCSLQDEPSETLVNRWKNWAELGRQYTIRETGELVTTIDVISDGRLRVIGQNGIERLLISDYFY